MAVLAFPLGAPRSARHRYLPHAFPISVPTELGVKRSGNTAGRTRSCGGDRWRAVTRRSARATRASIRRRDVSQAPRQSAWGSHTHLSETPRHPPHKPTTSRGTLQSRSTTPWRGSSCILRRTKMVVRRPGSDVRKSQGRCRLLPGRNLPGHWLEAQRRRSPVHAECCGGRFQTTASRGARCDSRTRPAAPERYSILTVWSLLRLIDQLERSRSLIPGRSRLGEVEALI